MGPSLPGSRRKLRGPRGNGWGRRARDRSSCDCRGRRPHVSRSSSSSSSGSSSVCCSTSGAQVPDASSTVHPFLRWILRASPHVQLARVSAQLGLPLCAQPRRGLSRACDSLLSAVDGVVEQRLQEDGVAQLHRLLHQSCGVALRRWGRCFLHRPPQTREGARSRRPAAADASGRDAGGRGCGGGARRPPRGCQHLCQRGGARSSFQLLRAKECRRRSVAPQTSYWPAPTPALPAGVSATRELHTPPSCAPASWPRARARGACATLRATQTSLQQRTRVKRL